MNLSLCYKTIIAQLGWENPLFARRAEVDLTGWKCGSSGYVLLAETGILSAS